MKTITMSNEDKNNIAVGTEVVATRCGLEYEDGDVLVITEQDYDYMPAAIKKGDAERFGGFCIHVNSFEVLDTSTIAPTTTAVKLLPGERPKHGVVYAVATPNMFEVGDKIGLVEDDGSSSPWFTALHGKRNCWGADRLAVSLKTLTYESEQTATPTPTQSDEQIKRSLPVGTRVRLTTELHSTMPGLQVGCEGFILVQDGSDMPFIEFNSFVSALYVETKDFEAIPDEQPVEVTQDNLAFGQVYKVLDDPAAGADEGDLLILKRNDGSNCPFFYNLSKPDGHDKQVCAWLEALVAVNVIESKQSKELET